jgi:uracil-DNA glycosylase family 4
MSEIDQDSLKAVVAEIKRQQSLLDYLRNTLGFTLRYAGSGMYTMPCPLHGGTRNGSFYVYTRGKNEFWICYGKCGKERGDLIEFVVRHHNNWNDAKVRPIDVINKFAKQFGINYEVTDADIAERVHSAYLKSIEAPLKEDDNLQSINYQVSMHCKKVVRDYPYEQVYKTVDKLYECLDRCIIERSVDVTEDRQTFMRAKRDLEILRSDVVPAFDGWIAKIAQTKSDLDSLNTANLGCSACYLRYSAKKVVTGRGNFLSGLMILDFCPSEKEDETGIPFRDQDHFPLVKAIEDSGSKLEDVWVDYLVHCRGEIGVNETRACTKLWLQRKIELIHPKSILCLGTKISKALFPNEDLMGKKKSLNGITYWFVLHPADILTAGGLEGDFYNEYKRYIAEFLQQKKLGLVE